MWVVDGKQEIYLEWPYSIINLYFVYDVAITAR